MAGGDEEIRVVATLRDELSRPLDKVDKAVRGFGKGTKDSSKSVEDLGAKSKSAASGSSALQKAISTSTGAIQKAVSITRKGAEGFRNVGSSLYAIASQSGAGKAVGNLVRAIQSGIPKMHGAIKSGMENGLARAGAGLRNASSKLWTGVAGAIPQPIRDKISEGVRNGISRAKSIAGQLVGHARDIGKSAGALLGQGLEKAADASISVIKSGMRGLESVAGAVLGGIATVGAAAFAKGFGRLSALESAEQTFTSMGHSAEDSVAIMKTAEDAVTGTAFGLGESASLAAQMLASGVKPGEELGTILGTVADAAARGGDTMQGMGNIFSKVLATGRLQGDEMNQMMERGIPVLSYLSDHLETSTEDVRKMVSAGEVGFEDFSAAMQKGVGGAAEASGKTFQGAIANIMTALGSTAAVFMEPFYDAIAPMAQSLVGVLKNMRDQAKPFMADVTAMIQPYVAQIQGFIDGLANADLGSFFDKIAPMAPAIGALTGAFVALGSSGIARVIPFISGINPLVAIIGGLIIASPELRSAFADLAVTVGGVLLQGFQAVSPILQFVAGVLIPMLAGGVATVATFLSQNRTLTAVLMGAVATVAAIALAYKGYLAVLGMVKAAKLTATAVTHGFRVAQNRATISTQANTVAQHAGVIAMKTWMITTKIATGVQKAFNMAMRMNPIAKVVTVIALLVGALVWFFTQTEVGRNIFTAVWNGIQAVTQTVVTWFTTTALPALTSVWNGIVNGVKSVGAWFASVWSGITTGVSNAVTFMTPAINFIRTLFGWISTAIKLVVTVWLTLLILQWKLVWTVVSNTLQWAWGFIQPILTGIWTAIKWLASGFMSAMTSIRNVITNAWNWIVNVTMTILRPIINWIRLYITALRITWSIIFNAIRNIVSAVFNRISSIIRTVWTAVSSWVVARVTWLRNVWNIAWGAIRTALSNTWNRIKAITMSVFTAITTWINGRVNWLKNIWNLAWSAIRTTVTNVWNRIKSSISTAWNWIKANVFDKMRPAIDALGEAFKKFRDTAKKVWDKVQEHAKKPVRFVVNTIYRDNIKDTFDKVAKAVGLDLKLPDIKLTGFHSGGIMPGYTPGRDVHTVPSHRGPVGLSGGEAIMRPEWTRAVGSGFVNNMNKISRRGVGAVRNAMSSVGAPSEGYAKGGVVNGTPTVANFAKGGTLIDAANWWVRKGARGSRHPAFGGAVRSGHSRGSYHYKDQAVDLNMQGTSGTSAKEQAFFDKHVAEFKRLFKGIRVIWRAKDHFDHMHIDTHNGADMGDFSGAIKGGDGGGGFLADLNPLKKLRDRMMEAGDHPLGKIAGSVGKKVVQGMIDKINPLNWFGGDNGPSGNPGDQGSGVNRWKSLVIEALKILNQPTDDAMVNTVLRRMKQESNGNPGAINNWDSNAKRGTPSKGLMQVIDPTFRSVAKPPHNKDIWDPLSNILAGMRWSIRKWGSIAAGFNRTGGYAEGGIFPDGMSNVGLFDNGGMMMPGQFGYNGTGRPELVTSNARAQAEQRAMERVAQKAGSVATANGDGGGTNINVEANVTVGDTGDKSMRQVEREFEQMMQRVFDKQIRRK